MTTREKIAALSDARARIADPAHWCRGYYAVDAAGKWVSAMDAGAVAWCIVGSLCRTLSVGTNHRTVTLMHQRRFSLLCAELAEHRSLAGLNDGAEHHEVVDVYDTAIARLKAQVR